MKKNIKFSFAFALILSACSTPQTPLTFYATVTVLPPTATSTKRVQTSTPKPVTPTQKISSTPEASPAAAIATEIPPIPNEIPNSVAEFDAMVKSGEIPTFNTDAELQAHIYELSQQWLLVDEFNTYPAQFFGEGESKNGHWVVFQLRNRFNFIVRDFVINPKSAEIALCEIILPNNTHKIIKIHVFGNDDKNLLLSKVYKDIQNGESLNLFVFTKLGASYSQNQTLQQMINEMPKDVQDALIAFKYPENIGDLTLLVTNAASFQYPAELKVFINN